MTGRIRWAAVLAAACTLGLAAVAVALLSGRWQDRAAVSDPSSMAAGERHVPARVAAARGASPRRAPAIASPGDRRRGTVEPRIATDPESPARTAPGEEPVAPPADARTMLGWRQGTWWTVAVRQYDSHSPQGGWVSSEYVFNVVRASASGYVVRVRFADHESQPAPARGVQVEAGYAERGGALRVTWVRPLGRGPKLSPMDAAMLMGRNALPLEPPPGAPLGGRVASVRSAPLGEVRGRTVVLGNGETGTYADGAPWWVRYSRGTDMTMELTGFER
jgi:hypothetical protein